MQIARALVWEFWAGGWRGIMIGQAFLLTCLCLIYGVSSWEGGVTFQGTDVGRSLQVGFYWTTLILLGMAVLAALGNPIRRYTLPASSLVIVACPMACAMVTVFMLYGTAALTLNAIFDAGWPILGPGLLAAVFVAWCQAVLWSTSNSLGLQLLTGLASVLAVVFASERWAPPQGPAKARFLENLNGLHVLLFVLATLASVVVGTAGFANLRRGSGIELERIGDWASRLFPRAARSKHFGSPTSAQFWLEWSERGYVLPAGTASVGMVMLLLAWCVPPTDGGDFVNGMSTIVLAPAGVIGIFLGSRSRHGEFGNFNGSRPLTDGQVAGAILKSATLGVISSAVIWGVVMAAAFWIVGEPAETSMLFRAVQRLSAEPLLARIALGVAVAWSAVGLVTSLSIAGGKVTGTAFVMAFGLPLVEILASKYLIPAQIRGWFTWWYSYGCLGLALLLSLAVMAAGAGLRLVSWRTFLLAASIALAAIGAVHFSGLARVRIARLELFSACCLIPVPLVAAPLAAWWNRHR